MGVKNFNVMAFNKTRLIDPEKVGYQDSIEIIHEELHKTRKSFIKIGWYLKHIHENKMYEQDGYSNIYDFAMDKFHISQPTATRFMNVCEEFSVNHNSPELDQKYEDFNISQLFEMLSMSKAQIEQVTPDMTVRQIREMKAPSEEALKAFYDEFIRNTEYDKNRQELKHFLTESYGKTYAGGNVSKLSYQCTPRGIKIAGNGGSIDELEQAEEITWTNLVKQINKLFPPELNESEKKPDDNIPGQTSIEADFPEYLPEEQYATSHNLQDSVEIKSDNNEVHSEEHIIDGEYREVEEVEVDADSQDEILSAYGLKKSEYPKDSLIAEEGCGHIHNCFACAKECKIRSEYRYCVEAPLGNPFECNTMNVIENIRIEVGEKCQFVNQDMAYHRAGDHSPVPCCKVCNIKTCGYRCDRAILKDSEQEKVLQKTEVSVEQPEQHPKDELAATKFILNQEKSLLNDYLVVEGIPEMTILRQKTIVAALAAMVCELEDKTDELEELEEQEQPELPILKNVDQRKEWLKKYKEWGVWYRDDHIDVTYYKYDFPDGSRLVVAEYPQRISYWSNKPEDECYYHLLEKNKKGYKNTYDEIYRHKEDNETYLIEFLKNLQKKGN